MATAQTACGWPCHPAFFGVAKWDAEVLMPNAWNSTTLVDEQELLDVLSDLGGRRWLFRGHSKRVGRLVPTIDREPLVGLSRAVKLALERRSIDLFRTSVRFFASHGEELAMTDDIVALMVLRHYGVPSRLLDWTLSPWVAAYFSVDGDHMDGEIWAFDERFYEQEGSKQWRQWPETTIDGSGDPAKFDAGKTAFLIKQPPNWFICNFYRPGFPRQNAQQSAYTITARFGEDHAAAIATLLNRPDAYHHYVVSARLKLWLRGLLREKHNIWRGSLFPDSAGAADTAKSAFQISSVCPA